MVITNLIPFTNLNVIVAFVFVVNAIIKVFESTQMGVSTLSVQMVVMLLLLVLTNSEARRHFKRNVTAWRGRDWVEVLELQQQSTQRGQATNQQENTNTNIHLPNQTYQETVY